jgi:hypothetical protein
MTEMTEMNPVTFTKEDILELTNHLSEFAEKGLSQEEWNLLVAIFAAAATHVQVSDNAPQGTIPGVKVPPKPQSAAKLRDQLRKAYIPGRPPEPILARISPPPPP